MEIMKQLKYLLIVNLFWVFSCGENNVDSNSKIDSPQKVVDKSTSIDTVEQTIEEHNEKEKNDSLNIFKNKDATREHLKVIINGEVYYKKKASDMRVDNTYNFRTKDNRLEYDIKTGKYNRNYEIHHGGKVIIKDTVK